MSHLDDTCKREAKYSRFGDPAVDHNSSLKDTLCLPQQLSLISIIKRCLCVQSSTRPKVCELFVGLCGWLKHVLSAFN